ncbi:MAG TPA: hypothetical protein VJH20_00605 [Candidatus Nanoarchaeia archaeon]|nr:hypothetical protein [Candidatus Nanoarchaeia archaeon]
MQKFYLFFAITCLIITGCSTIILDKCNPEENSKIGITLSEKIGNFTCPYSGNLAIDTKRGEIWKDNNGCYFIIHTSTTKGMRSYAEPDDISKNYINELSHFETTIGGKIIGITKNEFVGYCYIGNEILRKVNSCKIENDGEINRCKVIEANSELNLEAP